MNIDRFLSLSKWSISFICVMHGITNVLGKEKLDESCLLTLDPVENLWCAARTSDGRVYSAHALQHWLCLRKASSDPLHVIPTLTISDVRLCSPRASGMLCDASRHLRKRAVSASAICKRGLGSLKSRLSQQTRVKDDPPRPQPCVALRPSSCRARRFSIPSPHSAFEVVHRPRPAYPSALKQALPARIREAPNGWKAE